MTRDDVIRMAREAGLIEMDHDCIEGVPLTKLPELIALVAAAEREALIDIVAMHGGSVEIEAAIRARGQDAA